MLQEGPWLGAQWEAKGVGEAGRWCEQEQGDGKLRGGVTQG